MVNDRTASNKYAFTPSDSVIVLVDHQPGVVAMAHSLPASVIAWNVGTLARLGEEMGIPMVVTTTRETIAFLGTSIPEIQEGAPKAYAARIRRGGQLNAFDEPAFVSAVRATGRRNMLIAGITTDVCLYHSVVSALQAGYSVTIAVDGCGCTSELGDYATYDELRERGAVLSTANGILFKLYNDLSTPEGKHAEAILSRGVAAHA